MRYLLASQCVTHFFPHSQGAKKMTFFAPTGAQGVTMCVCPSVCLLQSANKVSKSKSL